MAGGLAAFFGVPLGGAIFACEVLHRNGLEYHEALVPATISGIACNLVFRVLCSLPSRRLGGLEPRQAFCYARRGVLAALLL